MRIHLVVSVDHEYVLALRRCKCIVTSRGKALVGIFAKQQHRYIGVVSEELSHDAPPVIGRMVVDDDDLELDVG